MDDFLYTPDQPVERGPLRVTAEPPIAYWHGIRIAGVTPARSRILHLLARLGAVSYDTLMLGCVGEDAHADTLKAQVYQLRHALPDGLRIVTERGWGYRLEVDS